jgi:hypothetical protein
MGVGYFTDADDFCEEHPDVVLLASSILSLEMVSALAKQKQQRGRILPPTNILARSAQQQELTQPCLSSQVLGKLPMQRLKRNTLFVDVLSVKEFPKSLLLRKVRSERALSAAPASDLGTARALLDSPHNPRPPALPACASSPPRWTSCARTPCLGLIAAKARGRG